MSLSATEPINWDDGRLLILSAGLTAKCESLAKDQLYAVLLYNTSQIDVDAVVTVVWSNQIPPSKVTVRGSTNQAAPPNFVFVAGADTGFVSISLSPSSAASVTAFIVSISMPSSATGSTGSRGVNSSVLPSDGQFHSFNRYDRYYTETADGWRSVTVRNLFNQFIYLQMLQSTATIFVINLGSGLANGQVSKLGATANAAGAVEIQNVTVQSNEVDIPGNGETWVWMNADSQQNSKTAEIALQSLSLADSLLDVSES